LVYRPSSAGCAVAPKGLLLERVQLHYCAQTRSAILLPFDALPAAPGSTEHREARLCLSV
jgi:hypothetical protein